jgi:hypothetical protein
MIAFSSGLLLWTSAAFADMSSKPLAAEGPRSSTTVSGSRLNPVVAPGAPLPPGAADVVVYASDIPAAARHGSWTTASDPASPNGVKLVTSDVGFVAANAPLPNPIDYVDVTFDVSAGTPYAVWLRLRASGDSMLNDSVWVQFSDATANGASVYPINTSAGLLVNLATDGSGSSLKEWGWQHTAYWLSQPTTVTFPTGGTHTLRIQVREDGVQLDQIVLSPGKYLKAAPGPVSNDSTIVSKG